MSQQFVPNTNQLPEELRELWPRLGELPSDCIAYGSMATSLRLGGEQPPPTLEFKTALAFDADQFKESVPFLRDAQLAERDPLTHSFLEARVETSHGPVQLTIQGDCRLGEIHKPDRCPENGLAVASLQDIAGSKMLDISKRTEAQDYRDVASLIERGGVSVAEMAGAARAITRGAFDDVAQQRAIEKLHSPSTALSELSERDRSVIECDAVQSEAREISFEARPHLSMGNSTFQDRAFKSELSASAQRPSLGLDLNDQIKRGATRR